MPLYTSVKYEMSTVILNIAVRKSRYGSLSRISGHSYYIATITSELL